jgi:hypothetical protein
MTSCGSDDLSIIKEYFEASVYDLSVEYCNGGIME